MLPVSNTVKEREQIVTLLVWPNGRIIVVVVVVVVVIDDGGVVR